MARTLTPAPTDRSMWRKLLTHVHPDRGGHHDLFIWVHALQEYVAGDEVEEPPRYARREPPPHPTTGERVDFSDAAERFRTFAGLTDDAITLAYEIEEPYRGVLLLLADCVEFTDQYSGVYRQQFQGATYKSLAAIAYRAGMSARERSGWYRVAEAIPLAQRHAGHILAKLQSRAA